MLDRQALQNRNARPNRDTMRRWNLRRPKSRERPKVQDQDRRSIASYLYGYRYYRNGIVGQSESTNPSDNAAAEGSNRAETPSEACRSPGAETASADQNAAGCRRRRFEGITAKHDDPRNRGCDCQSQALENGGINAVGDLERCIEP